MLNKHCGFGGLNTLMIVVMLFVVAILGQVLLSSTSTSTKNNPLIDFEMFDDLQAPFKNVDEKELMTAFGLYIEAAGLEEFTNKFTEKVHGAIEKRLQDALILQK